MREEILNILHMFQDGYDRKDVSYADTFMKKIFVPGNDISILGTSFGELCIGYDACKKLFTDDWEYWTFQSLDFDHLVFKDFQDMVFVYAPATMTFTYKNNDQYGGYPEDIKNILNESKDLMQDLTQMNWILAHFLHQRENRDRPYIMDLRVCFIFIKHEGHYKVKQIQFSVPDDNPDCRLQYPHVNDAFKKETDYFKENSKEDYQDLKAFLSKFQNDFMHQFSEEMLNQYFMTDNFFYVNVDHQTTNTKEDLLNSVSFLRKNWENIHLNYDDAYIEEVGDSLLVITNGYTMYEWDEKTVLNKTKDKIIHLLDEEKSNTEKLFSIRKEISTALRDVTVSDRYEWTFRVHLTVKKIDNQYKINYLQLSYPYYYLLENKTPYSYLVK